MKKMFAASLVAIMAVSAANAEIASVSYVDREITTATGDLDTLATTAKTNLTAAVNELAGKVGDQNVSAQVSGALTEAKGYTDTKVKDLADGAVKANTDAIAALDNTYATDTALNDGLALKQDKSAMATELTNEVKAAVDSYYPSVGFVQTAIADANNEVGGSIEDLADTVSELSGTVSSNKSAADTGIQEAKTAAATALTDAKAYADGLAAQALADAKADAAKYIDATELEASQTSQNTTITNAYTAADASLKTELEGKISAASGSAADVASDLEDYITSNDAAVAAAKTQADKGVADAAAAKAAADAAQADADANAAAISTLGDTYATDAELNTAKSDIKTAYEAADATTLSSAKTYADGLAGNYATAAQGAKADSAVQKADVTTGTTNGTIKVQGQEVSVAGLGTAAYTASTAYATAAQGAKADTAMQVSELKDLASWSSAGCATGTCSLVSKSGEIQWEAVRYAE